MPPSSLSARSVSAKDRSECGATIRGGSRSFYAASLLLPASVRKAAHGLYAFCRLSDDAVDLGGGDADAPARLRARLANIYAGRPDAAAADRAMADVVERFAIPRALPEALLEGLAWDADGRHYESLPALLDYAARVAGTVGAMMTLIMGVRAPDILSRACDLGVAMQLTNIARDVGEDARAGRLYLPHSWLREAGLDPEKFLWRPTMSAPLAGVIKRLLDAADDLYERALPGVAGLPTMCRPAILAAAFLYAEIGEQVRRLDFDSVVNRAHVPRSRKVVRLGAAFCLAPWIGRGPDIPPIESVAFLVDAVAAAPAYTSPRIAPFWNVTAQVRGVLDMWERLERAQQLGR
jgi:15-cis-phytoene synthase